MADVEHSEVGWQAVARFAADQYMGDAVVEACRMNLIVRERYLNGIAAAATPCPGEGRAAALDPHQSAHSKLGLVIYPIAHAAPLPASRARRKR